MSKIIKVLVSKKEFNEFLSSFKSFKKDREIILLKEKIRDLAIDYEKFFNTNKKLSEENLYFLNSNKELNKEKEMMLFLKV